MGVPVASVAVGKCYLTEIGQVRRVLEIKEAMVKYESRGKTAHGGSWGALTTVSNLRFARDVEREVPCDYGGAVAAWPLARGRSRASKFDA
jgi:hypothetical protein